MPVILSMIHPSYYFFSRLFCLSCCSMWKPMFLCNCSFFYQTPFLHFSTGSLLHLLHCKHHLFNEPAPATISKVESISLPLLISLPSQFSLLHLLLSNILHFYLFIWLILIPLEFVCIRERILRFPLSVVSLVPITVNTLLLVLNCVWHPTSALVVSAG